MGMTLDEKRRMAMLEGVLREIRSISLDAVRDPASIDPETSLDGKLLERWRKVMHQTNQLLGS